MNKVIIVLCTVFALAHGENHVDNYIKINRDQYHRVVDGYDAKLSYFRQNYADRVEAVSVQKEFVVANLVHTEERITPMLLLNGVTKQCVLKYRGLVEKVEVTKDKIVKCELAATSQLTTLLSGAVKVRDELEMHVKNVFESELAKCNPKSEDYTACVSDVISKTSKFSHENEKSFEYELEAAECLAKANVKKVVDCTHAVQVDIYSNLGQFDALLSKCLVGEDQCKPCEEFTCAEAANVYGHYDNKTIHNPLYGRSDNPKCLMLNVH